MKPMLTMIVPVYKAEKTLRRCLDSLVHQTLQDMEILVINDGSPDESQRIIEEYAACYPQIRYFVKENGGIANTRNFALERVEGKYFGFLDSDDYADAAMCEKMVAAAEKAQAQITVSHFEWVYPDHRRLEKEGPYAPGKEMMIQLFATLWNKIYLTECVRRLPLRFPDGYRYEDACFLYCIVPHVQRLAFVDEAFVSYVQNPASITHTNNHEVKDMIHVFEVITETYRQAGLFEAYHDELEYLHIKFFLGNSFLRSVQIEDAQDRRQTILMAWRRLNDVFPRWRRNRYLKTLPGMKNRYFRTVAGWNILLYAALFHRLKK